MVKFFRPPLKVIRDTILILCPIVVKIFVPSSYFSRPRSCLRLVVIVLIYFLLKHDVSSLIPNQATHIVVQLRVPVEL